MSPRHSRPRHSGGFRTLMLIFIVVFLFVLVLGLWLEHIWSVMTK